MYEKSAFVFWVTLILYLITLSTVSYVGVYLTYIAIPMIVISGLLMMLTKPKPQTQKILNTVSSIKKESNQALHDILDNVNTATSKYNQKSKIKHQKSKNDRLDELNFD